MSTFADSQIRDIYERELYWLAFQISWKSEELFGMFPVKADEAFISTKLEGLDLIYSILSDAAKIFELCHPLAKGTIHRDRATHFMQLLASIGVSEIMEKKVRNTIEHFGEYLDDVNQAHASASRYGKEAEYFMAFNLIVSHLEEHQGHVKPFRLFRTPQLKLPIYPIRVYVANNKRFYNMNWWIDLGKIYLEAKQIQQYFVDAKVLGETEPGSWASGLIVF